LLQPLADVDPNPPVARELFQRAHAAGNAYGGYYLGGSPSLLLPPFNPIPNTRSPLPPMQPRVKSSDVEATTYVHFGVRTHHRLRPRSPLLLVQCTAVMDHQNTTRNTTTLLELYQAAVQVRRCCGSGSMFPVLPLRLPSPSPPPPHPTVAPPDLKPTKAICVLACVCLVCTPCACACVRLVLACVRPAHVRVCAVCLYVCTLCVYPTYVRVEAGGRGGGTPRPGHHVPPRGRGAQEPVCSGASTRGGGWSESGWRVCSSVLMCVWV
jgi:hypothetical protein